MKKPFRFLFCLILLPALSFAQPASKLNFALQQTLSNPKARMADPEISLFLKGNLSVIRAKTEALGGVYKYAAGEIACIRIHLSKVRDLAAVAEITRIENNDMKLQPMNDQMILMNKVQNVHQGFNLPQGYDGTGVVVGIIDEGIDFTHPDFRDLSGHTRIKYVWDQDILNSDVNTQPVPYGYGKEYVGAQIDTSTHFYDGQFSHGSHVSGIACGNGYAVNNYKGVAPGADIIVVKMDLSKPDNDFLSNLVDAVKYVFDRANDLGEPCSINISLGTYFGSHDAKDIQAQAIDALIAGDTSRVVVCAAGNAGSAPLHLGYNVISDTSMTWFQFGSQSVYFQVWADSADFAGINFSLALDRSHHGYTTLMQDPFTSIASHIGVLTTDTIKNAGNRLAVVQSMGDIQNGVYSMIYSIVPDSSRIINGTDTTRYLWRFMTKGSGHFDAWSYDMVFDNLPDTTTFPLIRNYRKPDLLQNIVSSFTCSDKVITVGSYTNRNFYTDCDNVVISYPPLQPGALSGFSSHGPTRDGRIKPDITATGEWVLSCASQAELNLLISTGPDVVAAGKKHKRSSGTSMASPVVAGIAALYLQKNPGANWQQVKNAILQCADQDSYTGSSLPNPYWGYGKVNAYSVVKGCNVGIEELGGFANAEFGFNPNPVISSTLFYFDVTSVPGRHTAEIKIFNPLGAIVRSIPLNNIVGTTTMDRGNLEAGIYFATLCIDGKAAKVRKLIVE